ncbi:MAG: hypothetical protein ACRDHO_14805, partial [Actinomycetota bacterium]
MKWFSKLRNDESGVAMITVMMVGIIISSVTAVGTFVTIEEFRAGSEDRKASESLTIAEAGLDRFVSALRDGTLTWGDINEAGCSQPPLQLETAQGEVGRGSFDVSLTVYSRTEGTPPSPWAVANDSLPVCQGRTSSPKAGQLFAVSSTGTNPNATRTVRQVVEIQDLKLPIGIYAEHVSANGNPDMTNISLITPDDVVGREKMHFSGTDPYYTLDRFWPGVTAYEGVPAPAAVHSLGAIYQKANGKGSTEHIAGAPLNCNANAILNGQSMWDQSGQGGAIPSGSTCSSWTGSPTAAPPSSELTSLVGIAPSPRLSDQDFLRLAQSAKQTGLYCSIPTGSNSASCLRAGTAVTANMNNSWQTSDLGGITAQHFVAYFDFKDASKPTVNEVKWGADLIANAVGPGQYCSPIPANNRSVIIIVRNGSFQIESNTEINGAIFLPEGNMR